MKEIYAPVGDINYHGLLLPQVILKEGARLYHGVGELSQDSPLYPARNLSDIDFPFWFTDNYSVALRKFAASIVYGFSVVAPLNLIVLRDYHLSRASRPPRALRGFKPLTDRAIEQRIHWSHPRNYSYGYYEAALLLCSEGVVDGWVVIDHYRGRPSGDDIMICPEALESVVLDEIIDIT